MEETRTVEVTNQEVADIVDALERASEELQYRRHVEGEFDPSDQPQIEARIARWEALIVSFANPLVKS